MSWVRSITQDPRRGGGTIDFLTSLPCQRRSSPTQRFNLFIPRKVRTMKLPNTNAYFHTWPQKLLPSFGRNETCYGCFFCTNGHGNVLNRGNLSERRFHSMNLEEIDPLNMDSDLNQFPVLHINDGKDKTISLSITEQLYNDARRLKRNLSVLPQLEANRPENWIEIKYCLQSLSITRTVEAVDLSWSLLEAFINGVDTQPVPAYADDVDDTAYDPIKAQLLTNWDLWYSMLTNWHQVSRESLEVVNDAPTKNIIKPSELLVKLDGWKVSIDNATMKLRTHEEGDLPDQQPFDCTNSKTMSLLIDIVARYGKRLSSDSYAVAKDIIPLAEFAENLLFRMIEQSEDVRSELIFPPSTPNLNMVLMLWARASMVDRAGKLLQYAISSKGMRPDLRSYNAVLHAYSNAGDGKSAERVLYALIQQQQREQEVYESDVARGLETKVSNIIQPTILSWNSVIAAWARSVNKLGGAQRVEQLLGTMVTYSRGGKIFYDSDDRIKAEIVDGNDTSRAPLSIQQSVKPDLITLNTALSAWARIGEADTCARLLSEMRELYKAGQLDDPPDVVSYTTVMNAFAKALQPEKAEVLWDGMFQAYKQGAKELKPTVPMMSTILDAYSLQIADTVNKKKYEIAFTGLTRAERTFERMRALFQSGDLDSGPDTAAYNIMLKCYLYCGRATALPKEADMNATIADELLLEMKKLYESRQVDGAPTFATYSIVIQTWLTRPDGTARVIALLDEAWQKQSTGDPRMIPDAASVTNLIIALCHAKQQKLAQKLLLSICEVRRRDPSMMPEPTINHFGTIFNAYQWSIDEDTDVYAQNLYDQMIALHKIKVISFEPDSLICQSLVGIYANSTKNGAAKKAYSLFADMRRRAAEGDKRMQPNLKTCHQVLFSLSRKNPEPVLAETMVRQMYSDYKSNVSSVKPDNTTFNYALSAWARFDHPESVNRADAIFQEMQNLHKEGEIMCDVVTFNIILHCLASSSKRESAERAEKLLLRMNQLADSGHEAFRPTVVSYGCLISAWVRVLDLPRAEAILVNMYRESQNGKAYLKPHVRHFEQVTRAWLSTNDRDKRSRSQAVQNLMYLVYPSQNVKPTQKRSDEN